MAKNIRILYLKDKESKNSKFISFLKKEYKTEVYNCVLPNIYECKFGHLNIDSSSKTVYDFDWENAIGCIDSKEDITYEYGFDSDYEDVNTRAYHFKLILSNYLKSLNFKFSSESKVKEIFSSIKKSAKFIREEELKNFDLIIIEKLATPVSEDTPIVEGMLNGSPKKLYLVSYIKYKIIPNLLNKLLNSNIKIIHLMDYDNSSLDWLINYSKDYNKMLEKIGISFFSMGGHLNKEHSIISNNILVGIDFENRIKDSLSEFQIIIDEIYKKEISKKFLAFYSSVKNININFPIQLLDKSNVIIQDNNKIILRGNNETTKLYPNWDNSLFEDFANRFPQLKEVYKYFIKSYSELKIKTLSEYLMIEKSLLEEDTLLKYLTDNSKEIEENVLLKYSRLINDDNKKNILLNYLTFRKNSIREKSLKYFTRNFKFEEKLLSEYFSIIEKKEEENEILNCRSLDEIRNLNILKSFSEFERELKFLDHQINSKLIFGIADVSQYKSYIALTGNICRDKYFTDNTASNKIFIKNILEYLTELVKTNQITNIEFLPKIKVDVTLGELFVNNIKIELENMQFCYYLFFVKRAKNNEKYITVLQTNNFAYNVFTDEANEKHILKNKISPDITDKIIKYYEKSFPDNNLIKDQKEKYKGENEYGEKIPKTTPLYRSTFLSHYSRINIELKKILSESLTENQLKSVTIGKQGNNDLAKYGISLPADNIEIIS